MYLLTFGNRPAPASRRIPRDHADHCTPADGERLSQLEDAWPEMFIMRTRSRNGCIDCKQAKVKCDETDPLCGTCARRGRSCRGYGRQIPPDGVLQSRNSPIVQEVEDTSISGEKALDKSGIAFLITGPQAALDASIKQSMPQVSPWSPQLCSPEWSEIQTADRPFIEAYFIRHPAEMVLNNDFFIHEMNRTVISLLQQSPPAVSDSLSPIGENYINRAADPSSVLVSHRRTRLLNRLRVVNQDGSSPELVLMSLLALCGAELVDRHSDGKGNSLLALIDNGALILQFHARSSGDLNETAKYFARALARQDFLLSLSRLRRTRIDPAVWLDESSAKRADRLMGLTTSLAPMLCRLAALAEDVQSVLERSSSSLGIGTGAMLTDVCMSSDNLPVRWEQWGENDNLDLNQRAEALRAEISAWRPMRDPSISVQMSRRFFLQAYAWRDAALLYLFRVFHRPGSSAKADQTALDLSHDVMVHVTGTSEDIKLSLWPLFIASCELGRPDDREHAAGLFD